MSIPWQIIGESGAALDATPRTFAELNIRGATLEFATMATDRLVWNAPTDDATGAPSIAPDPGQAVSLWRDSVRYFSGTVTRPKIRLDALEITVEGPWWWMDQIPLTSTVTDPTGAPATRTSFVFATGPHATKITNLINRMIAEGVPLQLGTVDAMFDTPQITLSETTCAAALTELMKWVPDAVAVFDHTTTGGTGFPTLNIRRRGTLSATTYTLGTDAVESADIEPRIDLRVEAVEVAAVQRQSGTGLPQWTDQSAGTPAPGRRQRITISGPEIVPFLPPDTFTRIPIYHKTTSFNEAIRFHTKEHQALVQKWSTVSFSGSSYLDPYGITVGRALYLNGFEAWEFVRQSSGDPVYQSVSSSIPSGRTALILGLAPGQSPPEWLIKQGLQRLYIGDIVVRDGNSSGASPAFDIIRRQNIVQTHKPNIRGSSENIDGTGSGVANYSWLIRQVQADDALPIWTLPTADVPATIQTGTSRSSSSATQIQLATTASDVDGSYIGEPIFWTRSGVRHGAIIASYTGSTRVATFTSTIPTDIAPTNGLAYIIPGSFISPADYDYLNPPAGLAAGLLAAQNWTPYQGTITLADPDLLDGTNRLAAKYRLAGSISSLATMDALPRRVQYDLTGGRLNIDLGAPARTDFGSLASRVRRQPGDNIVQL
jgi:hypothetical protein